MTRQQTDATDLGALLGIANALVIAFGLSSTLGGSWLDSTIMIFSVGLVPSMLVGFILGSVAGRTHDVARWLRSIILGVPALCTVFALAWFFDLTSYCARAAIPTLVATLLLERFTRDKPTLPIGIVHGA